MTFSKSISTVFGKYSTASGRASRSEFWFWQLFLCIIGCAFGIIDTIVAVYTTWGYLVVEIVYRIVVLCLFLPNICVSIRRCHDSGHSGWWILCPIYNWVLMFFKSEPDANAYGDIPE